MNILKATIRNTISSGQINKLREGGIIPAIVYGGTKENLKISLNFLFIFGTFISRIKEVQFRISFNYSI